MTLVEYKHLFSLSLNEERIVRNLYWGTWHSDIKARPSFLFSSTAPVSGFSKILQQIQDHQTML